MLIGGLIKSIEEWGEKMGMSRREIDTARSKVRRMGILMEKKLGCRTGFTTGLMSQTRLADCANSEVTCPPSCNGGIRRPYYREDTGITKDDHRDYFNEE